MGASIEGSLKSPAVNHIEPTQPASEGDAATPSEARTIHLRPTATLAERVLLPGDPGRALALAQLLLEQPLMFNHHRGLWGYTGTAADGLALSVQSTGMGGPSAAIVLHELIALGVRRAIRVGTCGALSTALDLGDLVVAREAIAADGTSAALGAGELTRADPALSDALVGVLDGGPAHGRASEQAAESASEPAHGRAGGQADENAGMHADGRPHHHGRIVSTDLFYERDDRRAREWSAAGAIAVEMEASSLFAVGAAAGIEVGCLLIVTDTFGAGGARTRIDDHALTQAVEAMGRAAAAALA
jgi:uridine phosphorylase